MKVVINKCYGGFRLSHEACMRYAELCGFSLYPFVDERDGGNRRRVPWDGKSRSLCVHYLTKPLLPDGTYEEDAYWSDHNLARDDAIFVQVVEELKEKANGRCAELVVVDVPDGVDWEIEEYDGAEWVAEKHRTWG